MRATIILAVLVILAIASLATAYSPRGRNVPQRKYRVNSDRSMPHPVRRPLADLSIRRPDWTTTYPTFPTRQPVLFSDKMVYGPAPRYNRRQPVYLSDRTLPYNPIYTTYPIRRQDLLSDSELLIIRKDRFGNIVGRNIVHNDEEEQWGVSGNIGSGGQWNAGGSYTGRVGNGDLKVGGNVGNGGNWGVNAGYSGKIGNSGSYNVGGNYNRGGNWGVGASASFRF